MSWFQKHQRSRATVDAKRQASLQHQVEQRAVREASWEDSSRAKFTKLDMSRRIAAKKEKLAQDLLERRHKLAQLLESERKAYARELVSSVETNAQRRLRMIDQAKALQEERERQRVAEVEKIRAVQFKDGLDEFRVLKSKAIKMQCHSDRLATIERKKELAEQKKLEDMRIHQEYMQFGAKMLQREVRERRELAQRNAEMKGMVDQQLAEKQAIREAEAREAEVDTENWRARLDAANIAEERKVQREAEAKAQNIREMFEQNAMDIELRKAEDQKIKAQDEAILSGALAAEKQKQLQEESHTAERAAAAKRFQAFLEARRAQEAQSEEELQRVLDRENEKAWAQKEAVWTANRRARENLAAEVAGGRQEQLRREANASQDALVAKEVEKQEAIAKYQRGLQSDRDKAMKKQRATDSYRSGLSKDIDSRATKRQAEAEVMQQERQQLTAAFNTFDKNLQSVMGSDYEPPKHYRKKKVQWYF